VEGRPGMGGAIKPPDSHWELLQTPHGLLAALQINVIHKRVAHTSEWPAQNTIVKAINYNPISQQPYLIEIYN
jgi:hypothetical protein